ncbi:hypothetical protein B2H86_14885 [Clostridium botulinum]|uniref:hypothetical protein n=1 Tax=Clostridium botulinum TaxID=1491 RepID=UPI000A175A42|nr:hypothetical protein [Clostridium botulinum]OSA73629.1 hypothetical protein B2H86_14885 [Clostridium botulinum]
MIFYRLQSDDYEITSEHISFNCNFDTLEEAIREDIMESKVILEVLLKSQELKKIWGDYKNSNRVYGWVEPGTCCYRSPEDLYNFFGSYFLEIEDNMNDYILIFEGEFIDYGSEGEDCAKFIKEVERISVLEFEKRFNLKNKFSA